MSANPARKKRPAASLRQQQAVRLPQGRRRAIYAISAGLWLSGGLWLIFHYFIGVTDEFGFDSPHPLEKWWLILHAFAGLWASWMFGVLWLNHIKLGWRLRLRWISGGLLFLSLVWLIATGFLLYYLSDEGQRSLTSLLHWAPGLAILPAFLAHLWIRRGRKTGSEKA